jgi:uncharacterized protein YcbK (DUF882 family)
MSAGAPRIEAAFGSTRTISLYHIHTQETLTITYKKDGKYIPSALKKLNWFLRDWRENKSTEMDPKTIDLLWEMHTELGSKVPISIICGYRSEGTNNMLRRTVGGQAKRSFHIRGQAIDAAFPDISLKQMRYSALIRERGGVGYYPTSGIPFVHVDTGPVRAWPRLPRYELALLFPNGHTRHKPASGGPLTPSDVRAAMARHKDLAQQVAQFFDLHRQRHTPYVVAEGNAPMPTQKPDMRVASLAPMAPAANAGPVLQGAPQLVRAGETASRPARSESGQRNDLVNLASLTAPVPAVRPHPPAADRHRLDALFAAASATPELPSGISPSAARPAVATGAGQQAQTRLASLDTEAPRATPTEGWAQAPAYDDDHPEELSYRPFPLEPFMTSSASPDDSALVQITQPDVMRTLDLLDDQPVSLPLRLRPGRQVAQVMWAQQFRGDAVDIAILNEAAQERLGAAAQLASRKVKTATR